MPSLRLLAPALFALAMFGATAPAADDASRRSRPENERAFENTETYHALRF